MLDPDPYWDEYGSETLFSLILAKKIVFNHRRPEIKPKFATYCICKFLNCQWVRYLIDFELLLFLFCCETVFTQSETFFSSIIILWCTLGYSDFNRSRRFRLLWMPFKTKTHLWKKGYVNILSHSFLIWLQSFNKLLLKPSQKIFTKKIEIKI